MNSVALVGRLTQEPETKQLEDGTYRTSIILAVNRDYKDNDGKFITDFIRCILWNNVASATNNYCHKGDLVGIRGKLQTHSYEADDSSKKYVIDVIAERIIFITTKKNDN